MKCKLVHNCRSGATRTHQRLCHRAFWSWLCLQSACRPWRALPVWAPVSGTLLPVVQMARYPLLAQQMLGPTWVFVTATSRVLAPVTGRIVHQTKCSVALEHPAGFKCLCRLINHNNGGYQLSFRHPVGAVVQQQQLLATLQLATPGAAADTARSVMVCLVFLPVTLEGRELRRRTVPPQLTTNTIIGEII